jgi:activator of 2-hydroxyglutaryl-CoA dehydratase
MTTNRTFLSTNTPAKQSATGSNGGSGRFLGLDIGAETVKVVELSSRNGIIQVMRTEIAEHGKEPIKCLLKILARMDWSSVDGAAVCGRMGRPVALQHMPIKQAQMYGYRHFFGRKPGTIVSIGSHGFSVLEMRDIGLEVFRENGRCSQGTGNFLRQLVGRFSLDVHQASELCADVEDPAPLSGRCPVILKTDMTHLANKGENQAQILAGLFDAVCENVMALIKPGLNPPDVYLIGGVSRSRRVRNTFSQLLGGSNMSMMPLEEDKALFLEATGAAMLAIEERKPVPDLDRLCRELEAVEFDRVAPLGDALSKVRRMPVPAHIMRNGEPANLILGFDIGSTGSKLVSLDADAREIQWEGYRNTSGDPVGAAQALLQQFLDKNDRPDRVLAMGVTGSGREIVGSLMSTCYGKDCVFILNGIAAHVV